jgi:hypothetical protein
MQNEFPSPRRPRQRGQTIVLVAISLVSLLAMAVLAIDVVTLYVARTEIQRAADAAALAGAKAIADSSITTLLLADPNVATVQGWVVSNATTPQINAVLQNNLVAGAPPNLSSATVDWARQGNPHITVKLQSNNLPTFFSKIWGGGTNFVTATATAEAYNPANSTTITPIAPKSVKPWLVANTDPISGVQFVNTMSTAWLVDSAAIGKTFDLVSDCNGSILPCALNHNPPQALTGTQVEYVPAQVTPNTANVCPNSVGACNSSCLGASSYELSIECADANAYSYVNCGGGSTNTTWDNTVNPGGAAGASATGAACLIHATGVGSGPQQDTLNPSLWPGAPMQITGGTCSVNPTALVANSSSIATIPIIDTPPGGIPAAGGSVTVVGFLQAFIQQVDPVPSILGQPPIGSINITVLNIAGCSATNNGANPVVGGAGTSPVPVRLITPP